MFDFDVLHEKLKKVNEQWEEEPRRETPTIPMTPTREPRRKPKNPLKPVPGKKPKPKAEIEDNVDVELFKAARKGAV